MQIFSSMTSLRIPPQQRSALSALGSALDDNVSSKTLATSLSVDTALQFDSSQKSFQSSLTSSALDKGTVPTTTADGKYKVTPKDGTGQVTSLFTDMNGSDIELIEKATGATYTDGDFVGGDQKGVQDLTSALWSMRKFGTNISGLANPIKGDITADDLQAYIANRGSTIGNYDAIDKALALLNSKDSASFG